MFRLRVRDTQVGLKVFKREVLEAVLPRLLIKEFAFDIELLVVANYLGFKRIFEAPVEMSLDFSEGSKLRKNKPLFLDPFIRAMIWDTLAVFYRVNILRYYDNNNERMWVYDEELNMRVNTGEMISSSLETSVALPALDEAKKITPSEITFSVIIPVRSINEFMKENIENLKKLNYSNFEVVIVLDNKEEYEFKDDRFKIVAVGPLGPGKKRNIGARNAIGDILVFLDDDAYPPRDWLTNASAIFLDPGIYALGAPAITPWGVGFLEKCSGRVLESFLTTAGAAHRYVPKKRKFVNDYPTVNFFVRKQVFFEVGGFTEEFWPGEDTKLCLDLVKETNREFLYDPSPVVFHHRRTLFRPHLKQISRYGRHRGQFARIFPETSRVLSYFIPSLFVLGLLLGPLVSIFFPILWVIYTSVLIAYLGLVVYESAKVVLIDKSLKAGLYVGLGIVTTHIVYGINFLFGLAKRPELRLKSFDLNTGNYIEG